MTTETDELAAIQRTLAAYNLAGDRMRLEALAATFQADGVLEIPTATYRGRDAIIAGLGARRSGASPAPARPAPTVVRHHLTTSLVTLTGPDTAEGRSYFIVFSDIGPDHAGHYQDRLRKAGDGWLFEHRSVRIDWVADGSLFPAIRAAHLARRAEKT